MLCPLWSLYTVVHSSCVSVFFRCLFLRVTCHSQDATRLEEHKLQCLRRFGRMTGICLLDQNAGWDNMSDKCMPCLTQSSKPYHLGFERPFAVEELFAVHGLPVFSDLQAACGVGMPFDIAACSSSELRSFVGNGQSTVVMGTVLAWALSCSVERSQPVISLMPSEQPFEEDP